MTAFRTTPFRTFFTSLLLTGLLCGFFGHLNVQRSTSVLGLWLADHLTAESGISRNSLMEQARTFPDRSSFFAWAGQLVHEHPNYFSFPASAQHNSPSETGHLLASAWDSRFSSGGMATPTSRIELPKNWHYDARTLIPPTVRVGSDREISSAARSTGGESHGLYATEPMSSGTAIGAP